MKIRGGEENGVTKYLWLGSVNIFKSNFFLIVIKCDLKLKKKLKKEEEKVVIF
jgi:hypothetical protein